MTNVPVFSVPGEGEGGGAAGQPLQEGLHLLRQPATQRGDVPPGILYSVQCTLIVYNCRKFKCQGIFVDTVK